MRWSKAAYVHERIWIASLLVLTMRETPHPPAQGRSLFYLQQFVTFLRAQYVVLHFYQDGVITVQHLLDVFVFVVDQPSPPVARRSVCGRLVAFDPPGIYLIFSLFHLIQRDLR